MVQVTQVKKRKQIRKQKIYKIIKLAISYFVLSITALWAVLPIYSGFVGSLAKSVVVRTVTLSSLIPSNPSIEAYVLLFKYSSSHALGLAGTSFLVWLGNTLILSLSTAALTLLVALLSGYVMSRFNIPGKTILITFLYLMTFFPYTATAVPLYLFFANLHLINFGGLILAYSAGASIYNTFLVKIYVDAVPSSYEEIALLDGLSRTQAFFRITLRLILPIIGFIIISAFSAAYTDYAYAYAFLFSNPTHWTALIGVSYMAGLVNAATAPPYNIFSAGAMILGLPMLVTFLASYRLMTRSYSALAGVKQ